MSDFFTKKQKKYWCEQCHIFIEFTKTSIDKHNQSKNHINNSFSGGRYESMKRKFKKYLNDLNLMNNPKEVLLGNKTNRESIRESSEYFSEIKKERIKNELNKDNKNKKQMRKWGVFYDNNYKLPFFFNYKSGESVWEKPEDFDGTEEEIMNIIESNKEKEDEGNEGNVGNWEEVTSDKSVFGKRKKSDSTEKENKIEEKAEAESMPKERIIDKMINKPIEIKHNEQKDKKPFKESDKVFKDIILK